MSKFKDKDILGYTYIDGKRVTVLKQSVKKIKRYYSVLEENDMGQINQELIHLERHKEYLKKVVGLDDFSNEVSNG